MRYFIDTEYLWDHAKGRIEPVSIGIVAEDGREFYAVSTAFNKRHANQWVEDNVLAKLPEQYVGIESIGSSRWEAAKAWMSPAKIAEGIKAFIGDDVPEFWGDYAGFDYVVLSMLMGGFEDWPSGWPMHINDLQQDAVPSLDSKVPHHALADARAVRDSWNAAFPEGQS